MVPLLPTLINTLSKHRTVETSRSHLFLGSPMSFHASLNCYPRTQHSRLFIHENTVWVWHFVSGKSRVEFGAIPLGRLITKAFHKMRDHGIARVSNTLRAVQLNKPVLNPSASAPSKSDSCLASN